MLTKLKYHLMEHDRAVELFNDFLYLTIKAGTYAMIGFLIFSTMVMVTTSTLLEELPAYCESVNG